MNSSTNHRCRCVESDMKVRALKQQYEDALGEQAKIVQQLQQKFMHMKVSLMYCKKIIIIYRDYD